MDIHAFLSAVWPDTGIYCIGFPPPDGSRGMWHRTFASIDSAAEFAKSCSKVGRDAYFAVGTLHDHTYMDEDGEKRIRVGGNIAQLKTFIADLDVGDGPKKYPSQLEAIQALLTACRAQGLPLPSLVSSGYGVHAYWTLTRPIPADLWFRIASQLKAMFARLQLKVDASRTSDRSSVLRPVETCNFKNPDHPRKVSVIRWEPPVDVGAFARVVVAAMNALGGLQPVAAPASAPAFDTGLGALEIPSAPADFTAIAQRCAHVREFAATRGNIPEPVWYNILQLVQFTQTPNADARTIAHTLSSGHPAYSPDETDAKLAQVAKVGPTLCTTFEAHDPAKCAACPHWGKIKTPLVLGRDVRYEAPAPVVVPPSVTQVPDPEPIAIPPPEFPYLRTTQGEVAIRRRDEEGRQLDPEIIYEYDLYPVKRMYDEATETESYIFRTFLPQDGWRNLSVQAKLIYDGRSLMQAVADKGILPSQDYRDLLGDYMRGYMRQMQKTMVADRVYLQMGWKSANTEFLCGDILYSKTNPRKVELNEQFRHILSNFGSAGDLSTWVKVADVYQQEGYEEFAFGLMLGFGAPMFPKTGYSGAIFSLCGESGAGKSTLLKLVHSIYGKPNESVLLHQDTMNAKMAVLSAYNNLPVTFDEITNASPEDLSNMCYSISNGREKQALQANRAMRSDIRQWQLPVFVTTNRSLVQLLTRHKSETSGEIYRVLERRVVLAPHMSFADARAVFAPLEANYGLAGPIILRWYLENMAEATSWLTAFIDDLSARCSRASNERFWIALCGLAMLGCRVGKLLGLHSYDETALLQHCENILTESRVQVKAYERTARDVFIEFLNNSIPYTLAITDSKGGLPPNVVLRPNRGLHVRKELSTGVVVVDKSALRAYCSDVNFDYDSMERGLLAEGIVEVRDVRKSLGEGTEYITSPTRCLQVRIGTNAAGLVAVATPEEKTA